MKLPCVLSATTAPQSSQADMEESIEVVIAGYQKKNAILTDKEKSIVSYHEIGHALVAALQSHPRPCRKSPSCRARPARSATRCRSTRATTT